jgi:hypothetical protein
VPDWFSGASAPVYLVQGGLSRFSSSQPTDFSDGASLYGVNVTVNSAKVLTGVTLTNGSSGPRIVLYGATAY